MEQGAGAGRKKMTFDLLDDGTRAWAGCLSDAGYHPFRGTKGTVAWEAIGSRHCLGGPGKMPVPVGQRTTNSGSALIWMATLPPLQGVSLLPSTARETDHLRS